MELNVIGMKSQVCKKECSVPTKCESPFQKNHYNLKLHSSLNKQRKVVMQECGNMFNRSTSIEDAESGNEYGKPVKQEFGEGVLRQCQACLCIDRNLFHLGPYVEVYENLTSEFISAVNVPSDSVKICWECIALLRKAKQFQIRVKRSNELLQLGQNFNQQLSTLATQLLNETDIKYIDIDNTEIKTTDYSVLGHWDDINATTIIEDSRTIEDEEDAGVTEEKPIRKVDNGTNKLTDHWVDINEGSTIKDPEPIKKQEILEKKCIENVKNKKHKALDNRAYKKQALIIEDPKDIKKQDIELGENHITNINNGNCELSEHWIDIKGDLTVEDSSIIGEQEAVQVEYMTEGKKRKYNNRWAMKRALQNRKPKYKIIPIDNNLYKRLEKDIKEDTSCIKTEKCSECCSSKTCRCDKCDIGLDTENLLRKHKIQSDNTPGDEFVCEICSTNFANKHNLSTHMLRHYYKFECVLCGFICQNEHQKRDHLRKHRRILLCLKCKLKFCNRRDFFKHYKEWHERFVCEYCGISFKMRYCIKDHIRKQHSPFECKPCNKTFGRYNGLWLHNKLRHTPQRQPAYCVECDKHFVDVYRYRWHLANSAKHKPKRTVRVPCPECDKVFSKNIYMKDHYNLVHLKNFKYRCEECNKNFVRNADLVKHRRRVHEGILPPKNKICYVCGKGFTTNKILTNHLRTHTGERPYQCEACTARFAQRTALASHTRAVHRKLRDPV